MLRKRKIGISPSGKGKSFKAAALEGGADLLQSKAPVKQFDIYMHGFHCARHEPSMHMEAHHYCHQVNDEFFQCVIFDGNTEDANLIGVEYIISERLFNELPSREQPYWHPHNYEVFSGALIAPGLPDTAEKEMLRYLVNSYGKTWHTWMTSNHNDMDKGDALPLGDPKLMWSFNRFEELDSEMLADRNKAFGVDERQKIQEREAMTEHAHPQHGVDTLKEAFPDSDGRPAGVRSIDDQNEPNSES